MLSSKTSLDGELVVAGLRFLSLLVSSADGTVGKNAFNVLYGRGLENPYGESVQLLGAQMSKLVILVVLSSKRMSITSMVVVGDSRLQSAFVDFAAKGS